MSPLGHQETILAAPGDRLSSARSGRNDIGNVPQCKSEVRTCSCARNPIQFRATAINRRLKPRITLRQIKVFAVSQYRFIAPILEAGLSIITKDGITRTIWRNRIMADGTGIIGKP